MSDSARSTRRSPRPWRRAAARFVPGLLGLALAFDARAAATDWLFDVLLDGQPIGTHRFSLASVDGGGSRVSSEARFDVKLLGLSLYRYRHRVDERWSGGCLASIDARTDDNGKLTEVRGQAEGDRFELRVREDERPAPADTTRGCLMSFAYWNPALATQTRLLDPGSGRVAPVEVDTITAAPADLRQPTPVRGLRIRGLPQPIDVWYAGERWVGLDTFVSGGRRLSYRLH